MLNTYLADLNIINNKVRTLHYNVYGNDFLQKHQLFESYYNELTATVDDVAELILSTSTDRPVSSCAEYLKLTNIKEIASQPYNVVDSIKLIIADFEFLVAAAKTISEKSNDVTISNFFEDEMAKYRKHL